MKWLTLVLEGLTEVLPVVARLIDRAQEKPTRRAAKRPAGPHGLPKP